MTKRRFSSVEESFDWDLCVLCQKNNRKEKLLCPAALERKNYNPVKAYEDILTNFYRFVELKNLPFEKVFIPDQYFNNPNIFLEKKAKFHKTCKLKVSDLKLERLVKRINNLKEEVESEDKQSDIVEKRKSDRFNPSDRETKLVCFFCNNEEGNLHKASTFKLHCRVHHYAKLLDDAELLSKLSEGDMIAQDAVYHSECLIKLYKKAKDLEISQDDGRNVNSQILSTAFVELTNYMLECAEEDKNTIFKLDDLITLFQKRICDLGGQPDRKIHSTRFKNRLMLHFEDLVESKEGRHVYLVFDNELGSVLKTVFENSLDDDARILARAASILRREIFSENYQPFQGSFSTNCQSDFLPHFVKSFVDMLLHGTNFNKNNEYLEQNMLTISQLIVQNSIKRVRKESKSSFFNKSRESPVSTYIGLMVHAKTRKKGVIEELNDLGMSIPYRRVKSLTDSLSATVLREFKEDGVVCPRALRKGVFTISAFDNLDHDPSSTTAKGSFHGTALSLFQSKTDDHGFTPKRTSLEKGEKLLSLPTSYSGVTPVSYFNQHPETQDYSEVNNDLTFNEYANGIQEKR